MNEFATPELTVDAPSIEFIIDSEIESNSSLLSGYESTVEKITDNLKSALTEREYAITDLVISAVNENFNVPVATLRDIAESADLLVRPLPPVVVEEEVELEVDVEGDDSIIETILDLLKSVSSRLDSIETAARNNGIRL